MTEEELALRIAAATTWRKIAEVWPVKCPTQEIHESDGNYASKLEFTYRLWPPLLRAHREKVRIPIKNVGYFVIQEGSGLADPDD